MIYRECRLVTFHALLQTNQMNIPIEKVFLAMGGIKMGIYIFGFNKTQIMVPIGSGEIGTDEICSILGISYSTLSINKFLERYRGDVEFREENFFLLPGTTSIFNKQSISQVQNIMIGHSVLEIENVDDIENKVYMKEVLAEQGRSWIDIDVFKQLEGKPLWIGCGDIEIYVINKKALASNEQILRRFDKSGITLLKEVIAKYRKDQVIKYKDGSVRVDGIQSYDYIINHFTKIKQGIVQGGEHGKLLNKYAQIQLNYFRMFLMTGSTSFYRTEFANTVEWVLKDINRQEAVKMKQVYLDMGDAWKNFRVNIGKLEKANRNILQGVEYVITSVEELKTKELECIERIEEILAEIEL